MVSVIKGKVIPPRRPRNGRIPATPSDLDIVMESLLPTVTKTTFQNYNFPDEPRLKEVALLEYKKANNFIGADV